MREILAVLVWVACAALSTSLCAQSQTGSQKMYKCIDAKGKVYYTQLPPSECLGRPSEELGKSGVVLKRNEPPPTAEQTAAREAEREAARKKKIDDEVRAKEEGRKNEALLNTYTSVKDVDDARTRALNDAAAAIKEIENRLKTMAELKKGFNTEKEFYVNKPLPAKLAEDMRKNDADTQSQEELLVAKKKEIGVINAKYDEDKRRYIKLTTGNPGTSSQAASKK